MDRQLFRLTGSARRASLPRVLFLIGGLGVGGSERQLVELVTRVDGVHLDALVVTWQSAPEHENHRRLLEAGVKHVDLGPFPRPALRRRLLVVSRLASLIRSIRPDVVYPWLEEAALLAAPIARMTGIPVVVARRNISGASIERYRPASLAIRRAERLATIVTANSSAVAERAMERGVPEARIRLVHNGHPDSLPLPAPRGQALRIGYVAGFRPGKGHRRLLSVLQRVEASVDWVVDLAGTGRLQAQVDAEVKGSGLDERVRFAGQVSDLREFWSSRAIAVLLSDHEGSPNALIEAAFAGRPILATRVGGIPEVVAPGGGILVAPDDVEGAGAALSRLITNEALRTQLGQTAHEQAVARFGMEKFVQGHLAALETALAVGRDFWGRRQRP